MKTERRNKKKFRLKCELLGIEARKFVCCNYYRETERAIQTLRRQSYSHYHLAQVMLIKHI